MRAVFLICLPRVVSSTGLIGGYRDAITRENRSQGSSTLEDQAEE